MARYLTSINLEIEAENEQEATEVVQAMVNCTLATEIEDKIVHCEHTPPIKE
jgi:phosphoribosylformylglycinamidine (FGAM) synthase PurS component